MSDFERKNNAFDPYNLSEIEKIQLDIQRDLELSSASADSAQPDLTVSTRLTSEAPQDSPDWAVPEDSLDLFESAPMSVKPKRRPFGRIAVILLIVCTLGTSTLGLGIGFGIVMMQGMNTEEAPQAPEAIESLQMVFGIETGAEARVGSLADVVGLVEPSVVGITPIREVSPFAGGNPFSPNFNPFGADLFGDSAGRMRGGSGIIFAEDDERVFIATNHHVISGADSVTVSIAGVEEIPAASVGRSDTADLAVISVSKNDMRQAGITSFAIATFGDSSEMLVGDVVLAIGNTMGEGNSTTNGIISAAENELEHGGRTLTVLQTDAAINPGASGGALVNKRGEVVGILTSLPAINHYAVEGIGFSVASNAAKEILESIMNAPPRAVIGIVGRNITAEDIAGYNLPAIGVLVLEVTRNAGAEQAGMRPLDIITGFNGNTIFNMNQLLEELNASDIGDTVAVNILRDGRHQMVLQVTLGPDIHDNF